MENDRKFYKQIGRNHLNCCLLGGAYFFSKVRGTRWESNSLVVHLADNCIIRHSGILFCLTLGFMCEVDFICFSCTRERNIGPFVEDLIRKCPFFVEKFFSVAQSHCSKKRQDQNLKKKTSLAVFQSCLLFLFCKNQKGLFIYFLNTLISWGNAQANAAKNIVVQKGRTFKELSKKDGLLSNLI